MLQHDRLLFSSSLHATMTNYIIYNPLNSYTSGCLSFVFILFILLSNSVADQTFSSHHVSTTPYKAVLKFLQQGKETKMKARTDGSVAQL